MNGHGQELIQCPKETDLEGGRGSTRGGGEKERKGENVKEKNLDKKKEFKKGD